MNVRSLHHVQLAMPAGQEAQARAFYGEVLGLSEVPKPEHLAKRGGVWFRSASAEIHLGVDPDFHPAKKAHPALIVSELAAVAARCTSAGFAVTSDQPLPGFERLYVSDPFGNRIELLEPAANTRRRSGRPKPGEYASYAQADFDYVTAGDAIEALEAARDETIAIFSALSETDAGRAYAPGKWTLRQVLGHLIDDERIFAYRALCVARSEPLELPGFDEKAYVAAAGFEHRSIAGLLDEYRSVRAATIALFEPLSDEQWLRRGVVNGYEATVRGLAFHIAAHELHHLRIVRERYFA